MINRTAILIDGGFYVRRVEKIFGTKTPEQRADEVVEYCRRHIKNQETKLYRIYYYDCPPSSKVFYHPLTQRQINLGKTESFKWMSEFHAELVKRRKVALRRGEELSTQKGFTLKEQKLKQLCAGKIMVDDLTEDDFILNINQKGVDMRIGLDIANLAERKLVDQIIMITGDSDFVPAAKHARRAGIDFILDPLWSRTTASLNEHVDGRHSVVKQPPYHSSDPLLVGSENWKN